jgi:hypothetical protein
MFRSWLTIGALLLWGLNASQASILQSNATQTLTITPTPQPRLLSIHYPLTGTALQGSVNIIGTTAIAGFQNAELAFAYSNHPTNTWFLINVSDTPVNESTIATWDTSTISDGIYDLRLTVNLTTGKQVETIIKAVRVRNYSPIETDTPTPVTPTSTQAPGELPPATITPTATETPVPPSATPLPTNALEFTRQDFALTMGKGVLAVFGIFALIGLYLSVKKIRLHDE